MECAIAVAGAARLAYQLGIKALGNFLDGQAEPAFNRVAYLGGLALAIVIDFRSVFEYSYNLISFEPRLGASPFGAVFICQ